MSSEASGPSRTPLGLAIDEVVSRGAVRVPPYPSTAMQLQGVLAKDDYDTNDLVEAMRTDQVFAGNLLRLANSPMYRRGSDVTSIASAVTRVGARELTRLAMAAAVSHAVVGGPLQALRRRVWRESLAAAVVSEGLASSTGQDAGEAFVAGLLHDVGKMLALSVLEDVFAKHPELRADEPSCWREIEHVHVQLGLILAMRWQLPPVLSNAIAFHHAELEHERPLIQLVRRADAIVSLLESEHVVLASSLEALGLDTATARSMEQLLTRVPGFLNALDAGGDDTLVKRPAKVTPQAAKVPVSSTENGAWLELTIGGSSERWQVRSLEGRRVEVAAPHEVQPGLLVEVTLAPQQLKFWAVVEASVPRGPEHLVSLKPFALSPDAARQWETAQVAFRRAA